MRRTALIVGGCSGIGFGIAQSLVAEHDLILVYRENRDGAENARRDLLARTPEARVEVLQQPLVNPGDAKELMQTLRRQKPDGVEILINCFGAYHDQLFLTQEPDEIYKVFLEHLLLPTMLCRFAVEDMYRASYGRVINIGSISASYVKRGQVAYAAAKAGLEGLTKALAMETAGRGVTVNLICPGLIQTPSSQTHLEKLSARDPKRQHILPAGVWGKPSDVGSMAHYLVSDSAKYITGASFTIDGGRSLGDASL